MACERYKSRLIEEALEPGADAELGAHLSGCAECRSELDRQLELQNRIAGTVSAMVAAEPSPALLTRVRQRADAIDAIVAEDSARRASWIQWTITGVAVSALAGFAIFFAGRALFRQSGSGPQPAQTAGGTPTPRMRALNQPAPNSISNVTAQAPIPSSFASVHDKNSAAKTKPARAKGSRPVLPAQLSAVHSTGPVTIPPVNAAPGFNVIIPPGQREAVLRLVAEMRNGRVNVAGLLKESEQQVMTPIEIAPLKITPLDEKKTNGQSDGNHQ